MQYDFGTIDALVWDGTQLAHALNNWRDALYSAHRGATRPAYVVPGQMWINDAAGPTSWVVNVYMGAAGDVPLMGYDTQAGTITMLNATVAAQQVIAQASASPILKWNAIDNPIDSKLWHFVEQGDGTLKLVALNDDGTSETGSFVFQRDGSIQATQPIDFVGRMQPWFNDTPPSNYLFCHGTSLLRSQYPKAFAIFGTRFGDGAAPGTTFALPDLRGRTPFGVDGGSGRLGGIAINGTPNTIGATGGAVTHILTEAEMPHHDHVVNDPTHAHGIGGGGKVGNNSGLGGVGGGASLWEAGPAATGTDARYTGITIGGKGGNQPHPTMPPFQLFDWIVKVQ